MSQVTRDEVLELAREIIRPERLVLAAVCPEESEPVLKEWQSAALR